MLIGLTVRYFSVQLKGLTRKKGRKRVMIGRDGKGGRGNFRKRGRDNYGEGRKSNARKGRMGVIMGSMEECNDMNKVISG